MNQVPIEILLEFLLLSASSSLNRKGMKELLQLAQVCRVWRTALVDCSFAWRAFVISADDNRDFIELFLERSRDQPLQVVVHVSNLVLDHPGCTCLRDGSEVVHVSAPPCRWHFVYESLVEKKHSSRIHTLKLHFSSTHSSEILCDKRMVRVRLRSCEFLRLSLPRLRDLTCIPSTSSILTISFPVALIPKPASPTSLATLRLEKCRIDDKIMSTTGLTSLSLEAAIVASETLRAFLMVNESIQSLTLSVELKGDTAGPPAELPQLKHFELVSRHSHARLHSVVRIRAIQHLASILIMGSTRVHATGNSGFTFVWRSPLRCFSDFLGCIPQDARPTIGKVILYKINTRDSQTAADLMRMLSSFMSDAHTLEVRILCARRLGGDLLRDVVEALPQLKTIRFEVTEGMDASDDGGYGRDQQILYLIENLAKRRFEQGMPFSAIERMVIGSDEDAVELDWIWGEFYDSRRIGRYVVSA